ncbi:hypothetical protein ACKQTC_07525 [Peptococcus simiae]|uniref:Cell division protein FtsL n=1 Tax=Peptococcus simiae TaxID=1643805 RepID=A0ABW9H041_9FIRM
MTQSGYYHDYKGRQQAGNRFEARPDDRYKRALRIKDKSKDQVKPAEKSKAIFKFPRLRAVALIFVLGLLVAAQYSAVQTMGYRVSEAQSRLSEIKAVNAQLEQEYAALGNLARIEKQATEKMDMVMPDRVLTYQPSKATLAAQKKEAEETAGGRR